ncbi:glycosyltransferase involved in cell wall biosynthesis [Dyadobacter jejuensis]|uniref:Glycosyltransferase involved in cell wall biosynthesis n=1 Tax=Dyadobacter jejuensis TaxID=1082580 RepID=A0A316ACE7_9BACT|nr:glycosyltransferase family 2 protein [Dyadobacter jejuensis]PWJ55262.1 glycosyltransferase involved in cell wall biosynthesis [Dyadobacter jejuensis]
MISVAMCTYGGEKYLPQQLESIANQTIRVDELVVCDDRSKDSTIAVLKSYAEKLPFPVRIIQNEENLGSTKNFEKCISLCEGDIVFLTDQDDIWRSDRVEKQLNFLEKHPEQDAVFSNAMMIDDDSLPTGKTIWEEIEFDARKQEKWRQGKAHEILFNGFVVTGATLTLRKSCLERLLPFPTHVPDLIHDAWIAMVLGLENKISFIPENLIDYRIHASQQVGFGSKTDYVSLKERMSRGRDEKLVPLKEKAEKLNDLYVLLRSIPFVPREKLIKLYLAKRHFESRSSLPHNRFLRLTPIMNQVVRGQYIFSSKDWWIPAIGDLLE